MKIALFTNSARMFFIPNFFRNLKKKPIELFFTTTDEKYFTMNSLIK